MKNIDELAELVRQGSFNKYLENLYMDSADYQVNRYLRALDEFKKIYGPGEVEIFSAPGRTEIGGNHTDHQNGKCLAAAVNMDIIGVVSMRSDNVIEIKSDGYEKFIVETDNLSVDRNQYGTSIALVKGVMAGLKASGYNIGGFNAFVSSEVLSGSGLSSSAAFEVLIGTIINGLYNKEKINPMTIAMTSQYAENVYFNKPCGLLDQLACAEGGMIYIDFKNKDKPFVKRIDKDFNKFGYSMCITNTRGSHAGLTDEYAAIPKELGQICSYFGKSVLRDVDEKKFYQAINDLREQYGDRSVIRAIHVFEENKRVEGQKKALESEDFEEFKKLVGASGKSSAMYMQNMYPSGSIREQELTLGLAISEKLLEKRGVSRLQGGGFAGTIQALAPNEMVENYRKVMDEVFGNKSCLVLGIRSAGGLKVL